MALKASVVESAVALEVGHFDITAVFNKNI
jgi:hypothetical protein